jgi:hypothetical protein
LARIGITLNEVLRDFLGQLEYTYEKYIGPIELDEDSVKSLDLLDYFEFKDKHQLNKFLYQEASLEIFGHADQIEDNIMNDFNQFIMDIEDDEEHELELVSREFDKSIPSTYFFLSKLACKIKNVRFVKEYEEFWDGIDILVTANPIALNSKPENKTSVKIETSYNKNSESDFTFDSFRTMLKDEDSHMRIFNNIQLKED